MFWFSQSGEKKIHTVMLGYRETPFDLNTVAYLFLFSLQNKYLINIVTINKKVLHNQHIIWCDGRFCNISFIMFNEYSLRCITFNKIWLSNKFIEWNIFVHYKNVGRKQSMWGLSWLGLNNCFGTVIDSSSIIHEYGHNWFPHLLFWKNSDYTGVDYN